MLGFIEKCPFTAMTSSRYDALKFVWMNIQEC